MVVAAVHRGEAFAAAEFLMDYLKTRAPFWKREERPQGAAWVAAKAGGRDRRGPLGGIRRIPPLLSPGADRARDCRPASAERKEKGNH